MNRCHGSFLTSLCAALVLIGCGGSDTPEPDASASAAPVEPWLPPFALVDSAGNVRTDDDLIGDVVVVRFVSPQCGAPCADAGEALREAAEGLDPALADGVRWLTISTAGPASGETGWALSGTPNQIEQLLANGFGESANQFDPRPAVFDRQGTFSARAADGAELLDRVSVLAAIPPLEILPFPQDILEPEWLPGRRATQLAAASSFGVDHDFRFVERAREAGITFVQHSTDDSGKAYKPVHYDHGNGLAVADVDGDGLLDLFYTNQLGANELWRNRGNAEFERIGAGSAIELPDDISVTASFADVDNDGDPDLYVTTVFAGNHLYENDGTGRFTDVTAGSGLGHVAHSSGATFFDYNRDGLLDLFLSNVGVYTTDELGPGPYRVGYDDAFAGHLKPDERNEPCLLFRNLGGRRFEDVTARVGIDDESWSGDATPLDANGDGWQDLYVLNMQGHDRYWENEGGERFVDRGRELFPRTPWGSMSVKAFDYDADGDMDLLLSDMHSDMSENVGPEREKLKSRMQWPESLLQSGGMSIFGNALFRNDGGSYTEVSDELGVENYWPWGLSTGDLNADGYDDVFIASSMNFGFRYAANSLLLNDRGRMFRDAEFVVGVEPRRDDRTAKPWFVLDCPGADMGNSYCEQLGVIDPVMVWGATGSRSSAIFDVEGDGDLDIVTAEFNDRPMLLLSDLAERRPVRRLEVTLRGTRSNRDGLGSVVRVTAGGRTWTKVHDGKSGYLSQSAMPLYFGLGDADAVERVEVVWPSGESQTLDGPIEIGRRLQVVEP